MHIVLITPAPPGSSAGNRATAERWARLLQEEGHQVQVVTNYQDAANERCELLIALHAWRSHEAVERFRETHPSTPIIVALTGTDIYDHQYRFPEETIRSMELADCLIGLHNRVTQDIPAAFASKLVTVLQSAEQPLQFSPKSEHSFQVCVIGHLRDEKDSLRAAAASRLMPDSSRLRVINVGKAHTPEWQSAAAQEQAANPRFEWLGEIPRRDTQALMQQSHLMVISSIMEGGANVVSEACRVGLPILASDISGNVGLLGDAYPGYFRTGDEQDLARLLAKAESSPSFVQALTESVCQLAHLFEPRAEQASLVAALEKAAAYRAAVIQSA